MNLRSNEALLAAFRRGDRSAGDRLFARLRRPVAGLCWALSGERGLVEEAVQETYLRVMKGLPSYRAGSALLPRATWQT